MAVLKESQMGVPSNGCMVILGSLTLGSVRREMVIALVDGVAASSVEAGTSAFEEIPICSISSMIA